MQAAHDFHGSRTALFETVVAGNPWIESWMARWSGWQARLTVLQGVPSPRSSTRGALEAMKCLQWGEGDGLRWVRDCFSQLGFRLDKKFDDLKGAGVGLKPSTEAIISAYIASEGLAAAGVATKTAVSEPVPAAFYPVYAGFGSAVAFCGTVVAGRHSAAAFLAAVAITEWDKAAAEAGKATA